MEPVTWSVTNLLTDVSSVFSTAGDLIMANPVASVFVGLSLAAAGIGLFREVIHVR